MLLYILEHIVLFVVLVVNVESHLDSLAELSMLNHARALTATVYLEHERVTCDCLRAILSTCHNDFLDNHAGGP